MGLEEEPETHSYQQVAICAASATDEVEELFEQAKTEQFKKGWVEVWELSAGTYFKAVQLTGLCHILETETGRCCRCIFKQKAAQVPPFIA